MNIRVKSTYTYIWTNTWFYEFMEFQQQVFVDIEAVKPFQQPPLCL